MANLRHSFNYYPFGMLMPGRHKSSGDYRYGYQGSEKDDDVKGSGNSYTTEFRQLDPRLGRWLSVDPKVNPWESSYVSMENNPILYNDVLGDKVKFGSGDNVSRSEKRRIKRQVKARRKEDSHFDAQYKKYKKDNDKLLVYVDIKKGATGSTVFAATERVVRENKDGDTEEMRVEWNIRDIEIPNNIMFIPGSDEMVDEDSDERSDPKVIPGDGRVFTRAGEKVVPSSKTIMNIALWITIHHDAQVNFEGNAQSEIIEGETVLIISQSWGDRNQERYPAEIKKTRVNLVYKAVRSNLSKTDRKRISKSSGARHEPSVRIQR